MGNSEVQLKSGTYDVKIIRHERKSNHIEYLLKLSGSHDTLYIQDRYQSMREFSESLKSVCPRRTGLPPFPPKKWFGSMNENFIVRRRAALEIYFERLIKIQNFEVIQGCQKYFAQHLVSRHDTAIQVGSVENAVVQEEFIVNDAKQIKQKNRRRNQNGLEDFILLVLCPPIYFLKLCCERP